MKNAISPKLLVLLALSVVVAGIGALRLLTADDTAIESGFEPTTQLPIVVTPPSEPTSQVSELVGDVGRNPFARADDGATFAPSETEAEAEAGGSNLDSVDQPVFPDPDLTERGPSDTGAEPGDDPVVDASAES